MSPIIFIELTTHASRTPLTIRVDVIEAVTEARDGATVWTATREFRAFERRSVVMSMMADAVARAGQ